MIPLGHNTSICSDMETQGMTMELILVWKLIIANILSLCIYCL